MKNIIICFDGTWNRPENNFNKNSNVFKIFKICKKINRKQLVWYDEGVGNKNLIDKWGLGGMFGKGLSENTLEGYEYLINNYKEGDRIFLLGFSRGAFTARSLSGLINACGIVSKSKWKERDLIWNSKSVADEAWNHYLKSRRRNLGTTKIANKFKQENSYINMQIEMVGVWDTVSSYGLIKKYLNRKIQRAGLLTHHDINHKRIVNHTYHALAIDEKRNLFKPERFRKHKNSLESQVLEEVWFAGSHSNVGGGYKETGLSDLSLIWMIKKMQNLNPNPNGILRKSDEEGVFKITGSKNRRIPRNAKIHNSVLERLKNSNIKNQTRYRIKESHIIVD